MRHKARQDATRNPASCTAICALAAAGLLAALLPMSAGAAPVYSYFPSGVANDAKMLCIAGDGFNTLSGTSVTVSWSVDNTESDFQVGFFDGASNAMWDMVALAFPTTYTLWADPLGDGSGVGVGAPVATWTDAMMSSNSWTDFTVNTSAAARSPSGNYFYSLHVEADNPAINSVNAFKVRVEGYTYIIPTTVFGYVGAYPTDPTLVYPSYPSYTPTTYDGRWDFYMNVAENSTYIDLWDGDFDVAGDTDDPNTSIIPPFDSGWGVLDGARPGSPIDDYTSANYRRTPNINYSIILPDGTTTYANSNVSGNTEWELFRLDTTTSDPSVTDHFAPSLPSGMYNVRVEGVDMHNLNALRFEHPIIGVDESGRPMPPPAPFVAGDFVFNDIDQDGIQDPGEDGIPGVVLTLRDAVNGRIIAADLTDANGNYGLNSWNGTYEVVVENSNFGPGGALEDFVASDPNPPRQLVTIASANVEDADFGFYWVSPNELDISPDRTASMAPGGWVDYSFTVFNNRTEAGTFDLAATSILGWSTEVRDAGGNPISQVSLPSQESTTVIVRVSVPLGTPIGTQDVTWLTGTLVGDPGVTDTASGVTTVRDGLTVEPDNAEDGAPGLTLYYTHTVTNSRPATRTVSLTAVSSRGWTAQVFDSDGITPVSSVDVGPYGATHDVVVAVTIPAGTASGTVDNTVVTATADTDVATATDTTTCRNVLTYSDGTYSVPKDSFVRTETVYGRATGLSPGTRYRIRYLDPGGTVVSTSGQIRADANGSITYDYTTTETDPTGTWTIQVRNRTDTTTLGSNQFDVTYDAYDAEITALSATDAPGYGSDVAVTSSTYNSATTPILGSTMTYVIWWDGNGNSRFDAGDTYIDSSGQPNTWDGTSAVSTHVTTGIDVPATSMWTDPPWTVSNGDFPNQGVYNVTATWTDPTGTVIDEATSQFFSVPALGWLLFALTACAGAAIMWKRRTALPAARVRGGAAA